MQQINEISKEFLRIALNCLVYYIKNNPDKKQGEVSLADIEPYFKEILEEQEVPKSLVYFSRIRAKIKGEKDKIQNCIKGLGLVFNKENLSFELSEQFHNLVFKEKLPTNEISNVRKEEPSSNQKTEVKRYIPDPEKPKEELKLIEFKPIEESPKEDLIENKSEEEKEEIPRIVKILLQMEKRIKNLERYKERTREIIFRV